MESITTNYAHTQLICNMGFQDKRVLLFSHYSKREEVESHNYFTLEQLDDRFDIIIILTNCPNAWEPKRPNYNTAFNRCIECVFESAADFTGITSSHEGVFHLQSYFMLFNKSAVSSIVAYFKTCGLPMNHSASISKYELGITTQLMQEGLTPFAMI